MIRHVNKKIGDLVKTTFQIFLTIVCSFILLMVLRTYGCFLILKTILKMKSCVMCHWSKKILNPTTRNKHTEYEELTDKIIWFNSWKSKPRTNKKYLS